MQAFWILISFLASTALCGDVSPKHRHAFEKVWLYYAYQVDLANLPGQRTVGVRCVVPPPDGNGPCLHNPNGVSRYEECVGSVRIPAARAGSCTFKEFMDHIIDQGPDDEKVEERTKLLGFQATLSSPGVSDILIDEEGTVGNSKSALNFLPPPCSIFKDGTGTNSGIRKIGVKVARVANGSLGGTAVADSTDYIDRFKLETNRVRLLRQAGSDSFIRPALYNSGKSRVFGINHKHDVIYHGRTGLKVNANFPGLFSRQDTAHQASKNGNTNPVKDITKFMNSYIKRDQPATHKSVMDAYDAVITVMNMPAFKCPT